MKIRIARKIGKAVARSGASPRGSTRARARKRILRAVHQTQRRINRPSAR